MSIFVVKGLIQLHRLTHTLRTLIQVLIILIPTLPTLPIKATPIPGSRKPTFLLKPIPTTRCVRCFEHTCHVFIFVDKTCHVINAFWICKYFCLAGINVFTNLYDCMIFKCLFESHNELAYWLGRVLKSCPSALEVNWYLLVIKSIYIWQTPSLDENKNQLKVKLFTLFIFRILRLPVLGVIITVWMLFAIQCLWVSTSNNLYRNDIHYTTSFSLLLF